MASSTLIELLHDIATKHYASPQDCLGAKAWLRPDQIIVYTSPRIQHNLVVAVVPELRSALTEEFNTFLRADHKLNGQS